MIVARKPHRCAACSGPIAKGETYYRFNGIFRGEYQYWGMHEECYQSYGDSDDLEFTAGSFPISERVKAQMAMETIQ